jgi:16S rRNA (adenine1518-N6/adenine1519-N6)-dimethyltransferase
MSDIPAAKKSLGQHWLYDDVSLRAMCVAADLRENEFVLEIGPGLGTLTKYLVQQVKEVLAVEYDGRLATELINRVKADNLVVTSQDILQFDFTELPPAYKIVANIPYYLTSNLIRIISESSNPPALAVLLVQKEVAERVAAKPGAMSLLSVSAQYYWEVTLADTIPAILFTPPPKVDSQILILHRRMTPLFKNVSEQTYFNVVKAGFSQRRKTLSNSLSGGLRLSKSEANALCQKADIDPGLRAQTLSLADWHKLYLAMQV